jgi:hypothetical protein
LSRAAEDRGRADPKAHVLAATRDLNRLERVVETHRATLGALATLAPRWLRPRAPPVTRKGLALTGYPALPGGLWWLDQPIDYGAPSAGNGSSPRSGSGGRAEEKSKDTPAERRLRKPEE